MGGGAESHDVVTRHSCADDDECACAKVDSPPLLPLLVARELAARPATERVRRPRLRRRHLVRRLSAFEMEDITNADRGDARAAKTPRLTLSSPSEETDATTASAPTATAQVAPSDPAEPLEPPSIDSDDENEPPERAPAAPTHDPVALANQPLDSEDAETHQDDAEPAPAATSELAPHEPAHDPVAPAAVPVASARAPTALDAIPVPPDVDPVGERAHPNTVLEVLVFVLDYYRVDKELWDKLEPLIDFDYYARWLEPRPRFMPEWLEDFRFPPEDDTWGIPDDDFPPACDVYEPTLEDELRDPWMRQGRARDMDDIAAFYARIY